MERDFHDLTRNFNSSKTNVDDYIYKLNGIDGIKNEILSRR